MRTTNTIRLPLLVQKVSEQYHLDGGISPFIDVFPALQLADGTFSSRLYLPVNILENVSLAPKDKIVISIAPSGKCTLDVVEESDKPRIPLKTDTCPICGSALLPPLHKSRDIGRCVNRACPAQMPHFVLLMLSALGLSFAPNMRHILEQIISRGMLITPADFWILTVADLYNANVELLDVQMFIQYIHSIRGHCTVKQVLAAMRIPEWDDVFLQLVNAYWLDNKLSVFDLGRLLDSNNQYRKDLLELVSDMDNKSDVDYFGNLDTFISIGLNRQFYEQFILTLYA